MIDNELKKLREECQYIHSNMECHYIIRILLPFWSFKLPIWATKQVGPQQLDHIFFDLIKNKINTREQIAKQLGVDEDEFIFTHLDALISSGYISKEEDIYDMTKQGQDFLFGTFREERFDEIQFKFIWGDIRGCIESEIQTVKHQRKNICCIDHSKYPTNDDLLTELAGHFNKIKHEDKLVFYDLVAPEKGHYLYDKVYAEHVALFYSSKNDKDKLHIDLRILDKNDSIRFRLCEELSKKVNGEQYWHEKFEEIYNKRNNVRDN